jgi:hypothetical protein
VKAPLGLLGNFYFYFELGMRINWWWNTSHMSNIDAINCMWGILTKGNHDMFAST